MLRSAIALAALLAATPAAAHIVFAEPVAEAGGYYAGFLRVSHGCEASPTVALRVELPATVLTARPQPKPGWTLAIERTPLAEPVPGEGGTTIRERVSAVTWSGALPADQFDQFGLMMKLPDAAGPLYFPTTQTCAEGRNEWTAVPGDPAEWHALEHPAPILTLEAAAPPEHHGH
ncbi:MAG TPA: YcnI family protein [Croceibacterium sp.]|nr:YcnI family protein [Croceibacterium sp.]